MDGSAMSRRISLTPSIVQQIVAGIRAGAYPHVAAEAAGVPAATFADWLQRGEQNHRRYREFAAQVRQAQAQARLKAEIDARAADPRFWLRHGPGRETTEAPGWTQPVKVLHRTDSPGHDPFGSAEWALLWATILAALQDFPDARQAIADAVGRLGEPTGLDR
jgi:hypothetical protein